MRTWGQAWAALRRCLVAIDQTIAARASRRNGERTLRARGHPWRRFCAQGRGWIRDWQRERERIEAAIRAKRRAERRSLTLLLNLLDSDQREDFRAYGHIYVIGGGSGERYRIRVALFANIDVMSRTGAVTHRLCAQPCGDVPMYDVMAGQLLYLQDPNAENRFLAHARIHPTRPDDYVSRHQA